MNCRLLLFILYVFLVRAGVHEKGIPIPLQKAIIAHTRNYNRYKGRVSSPRRAWKPENRGSDEMRPFDSGRSRAGRRANPIHDPKTRSAHSDIFNLDVYNANS